MFCLTIAAAAETCSKSMVYNNVRTYIYCIDWNMWQAKFTTEHGAKAQTEGGGGQHHAPSALPLAKRPCTRCTGCWEDPKAGMDECGNLATPTGNRSPDRPGSSESLYRLTSSDPRLKNVEKYLYNAFLLSFSCTLAAGTGYSVWQNCLALARR